MADLVVDLYGTRVGHLTGRRDAFDFVADAEGIERFGLNSPALSIAVPLLATQQRSNLGRRRAFFEEILSEGAVREQLAVLSRLDTTNTVSLLARYGRDVAGAVQIWDPDDPLEPRTPTIRPVVDSEIAEMFDEVKSNPLGNKGRRRLSSLAGVQDKVLIARAADGWAEPLDGYPSSHILKPQSGKYPSLIFDEEYGARFARSLSLANFETRVETFAGRRALVVERYDRDGDGGRLHQEDFNQVLGHRGDEKYETGDGDGRLRAIAAVLREHAPAESLRDLLRMVTLSAAIGNLDLHAKNISILHDPDGGVRLAPMYDVVPQLHLGLDEELSLHVNGVSDYTQLTGADLVAEAESWRMKDARVIVEETLGAVEQIAEAEHPLPGADPGLTSVAVHQSRRLRETLTQSASTPGDVTTGRIGGAVRQDSTAPEVFPSRIAAGGWGGPVR